jgi:2-polyprenyl-3-methyl-5-hydroxy-6-metoxy-1,4-benzoquinol methylase
MPDFSERTFRNEMMDNPGIPDKLFIKNLQELDWLNRYTRGHAITLAGLEKMGLKKGKKYELLDIGCGSGDAMKHMAKWAQRQGFNIKFTGIDISQTAIDYLSLHCKNYTNIKGKTAECFSYLENMKTVDIVHCSLFCHHLTDTELRKLFPLLPIKTRVGAIINDLKRSRWAWYGAWILPRLLNGTPMAKHDGPVSVLKGFQKEELITITREAGIHVFKIEEKWPSRYLITLKFNK